MGQNPRRKLDGEAPWSQQVMEHDSGTSNPPEHSPLGHATELRLETMFAQRRKVVLQSPIRLAGGRQIGKQMMRDIWTCMRLAESLALDREVWVWVGMSGPNGWCCPLLASSVVLRFGVSE